MREEEVIKQRMSMPPLTITDPEGYLTKNAMLWKQTVRDNAKEKWSGSWISEPCSIQLAFSLPTSRFYRVALFNLLKSTIDGVSSVIFKPSSRGGIQNEWNHEDFWIMEIVAYKCLSPTNEQMVGINTSIFPTASNVNKGGLFAKQVFIPETKETPLLSVANQEPTEDIIQQYKHALISSPLSGSSPFFGGGLRFVLPDELATDLDNHSIPTARILSFCLSDTYKPPQRLVFLYATKERARYIGEVGVHIQVWQEPNNEYMTLFKNNDQK